MATLEGNVTTLQNAVDLMATNIAEMMALLRGPNRASSSSIPPLARGPTVDPAPWVPPTHEPEGDIAAAPAPTIIPVPALHPTRAPAIHPVDFGLPRSTIPAIASLPPMTIPVPDPVMFAPPPVPVPAPATIYTAPPPMGFPASSAPVPAHTTEPFPYQAPPPINITFSEPGTPTQAAPRAPPTNFFPETETKQERRMKKMEETIRALQASDPRHSTSYQDSTLFPGMQLPAKVKTPQYRPSASRTPQPTQQALAPQGQQGGAMQARQRIQFTPLPTPLSHIYRQLLAGDMIRPTVPGPSFVPANQDQSLRCEYHSGAPGHTTDNCWKLREEV
ncbi:hypothetical protein CRG98_005780 [Punica granatum]|uniref:Extensin-like n=1 Tax=Punica granatum TaxID=22663 RepID=A0A2I0L110_PUNGR|nr:hypothetical protein CRG98_005780 [Punica granatum]